MRLRFFLSEAGAGLRRNVTMSLAAVVTVLVMVTLLGLALIIRTGTDRTRYALLNTLQVSVYLQPACGTPAAGANCLTTGDTAAVQKTLQSLPEVDSITYVSAADAYARFKKQFAGEPTVIQATPPSYIGAFFSVKLRNPKQYPIVSSAVGTAPGVQTVADASSDLNVIFRFLDRISLAVLFFALLLIISTCLLIYNAMRVAAFTRRRETGIMRLVGANDLAIQAPFVLEGAAVGIIGSGLAVALLVLIRELIHTKLYTPALAAFGEWSTLTEALPIVIVIGVLLPTIASLLTLQRHLRV